MLLHTFGAKFQRDLSDILLASAKLTGTYRSQISSPWSVGTGHLRGMDQVLAFSDELLKSTTRPVMTQDDRNFLLRLYTSLNRGNYNSVLLVEEGIAVKYYGSPDVEAFDKIVAAKDMKEFRAELALHVAYEPNRYQQ